MPGLALIIDATIQQLEWLHQETAPILLVVDARCCHSGTCQVRWDHLSMGLVLHELPRRREETRS